MKEQQEAERLIELFQPHAFDRTRDGTKPYSIEVEISNAKACAAICVKEIMEVIEEWDSRFDHYAKVLDILEGQQLKTQSK